MLRAGVDDIGAYTCLLLGRSPRLSGQDEAAAVSELCAEMLPSKIVLRVRTGLQPGE